MESLFRHLSNLSADRTTNLHFQNSGMTNKFNELEYGFFPLGDGILSDKKQHDSKFKTMVLGNDFGTDTYLTKCINNDRRESEKNPTINNLKKIQELNSQETFFTNFHLGVRKDGTNTKRTNPLTKEFQHLCYDFFLKQLKTVDPETVICLGRDVKLALLNKSEAFSKWKPKYIKELYADGNFKIDISDKELGNRTFILIPHPCDSRNFTEDHINAIRPFLS